MSKSVFFACIGVLLMLSEFALADLPQTHDVSSLQLKDEFWSAAQTEDGKPYRSSKAKTAALIELPAWWDVKTSPNRPPANSRFTFEVVYKDASKSPVQLFSYSASRGGNQRTELHRFGGTGDGAWKIAVIPSGWDFHYIPAGSTGVQLFIQSDEPVAVRSVTVREAKPEDATRWEAETRDGVRTRQQPKLDKLVDFAEAQKPEIGDAKKAQVVLPYARNYLQSIYRNSAPQKGEADGALSVRMALNEFEPAAFGVYANGQPLTNVTFDVSALKGSAGELACQVEKRTAEYALIPKRRPGERGAPAVYDVAYFPQRLWPMFATDIPANNSGWFFVILKTDPAKSKPGIYEGTVTVNSDQGKATLPLKVEVLDLKLLSMDEAGLVMGGCTTGLIPAHEVAELRDYNHNMINLWIASAWPRMSKDGDKLKFDFAEMDDWMQSAKQAGCNSIVWFLGGDPYRFPGTMTLGKKLYETMYGPASKFIAKQDAEKDHVLPEVKPLYAQWVKEVTTHAKQKGWPELILTPFDEPAKWIQEKDGTGPWIKPQFKEQARIIHDNAPGVRVYGSIHHATAGLTFLDDIDVFCTNAIDEDNELGDKVRAAGKDFWQYSGTSMGSPPNVGRYNFGWYFAAFDSRGSLAWAYNWVNGADRFDNSASTNEWAYGWTTPWSLVPSPFMEGLREAWDDRRYLETLRHLAKEKKTDIAPFLASLKEKTLAARGRGGQDKVFDFWEESKRLDVMDELRWEVLAEIRKLQGKPAARGE